VHRGRFRWGVAGAEEEESTRPTAAGACRPWFMVMVTSVSSPSPSTRCHRRRRPPTRCRYRAGWPVWKSHSGSSRAARRLLVFWGVLVENPQAIHPLSPAWPSRSDGFGRLLGSTCTWYIAISDKKLSYLVHTDPPFSNPHHVPTTSSWLVCVWVQTVPRSPFSCDMCKLQAVRRKNIFL
jgi:hypothetical protein